jgi:hypothetical protein
MGRKFGKKNIIKVNPLAYNIGLIGVGGIGKTTLAKNVCEKLVGENGYIIANLGREDGIDAIAGAIYEDIEDWDKFEDFCDDVIDNKLTDYKDLKVIVWDTIGELIRISEPEAIRRYNRTQMDKKNGKSVQTINSAWGGFGKGEAYTMDMIMEKMWELKKVGVAMFLIGHTKSRTQVDPTTGTDFDILTTDLQYNYFNALKTKLHVLGVATIDRKIVTEKTGKKNIMGKEKEIGRIKDEHRKITFRDDNFSIDSKSRFSEIINDIPFDTDEFIKAIEDAILAEHKKQENAMSIEESRVQQELVTEKLVEENVQKKKLQDQDEQLQEIIEEISQYAKENRSNPESLKALMEKSKELGLINPLKVKDLKQAEELLRIIQQ